jgi:hypothetical protein
MKIFLSSLALLISFSVLGDIDPIVLINGTIGGSFDDKEVKIKDSLGQIYIVPRSVFPKDFVFVQGAKFAIEVHENDLKDAKKLKK